MITDTSHITPPAPDPFADWLEQYAQALAKHTNGGMTLDECRKYARDTESEARAAFDAGCDPDFAARDEASYFEPV